MLTTRWTFIRRGTDRSRPASMLQLLRYAVIQPGFDSAMMRAGAATVSAIARGSVLTRRSRRCRLFPMMACRSMFMLTSGLSGAYNAED